MGGAEHYWSHETKTQKTDIGWRKSTNWKHVCPTWSKHERWLEEMGTIDEVMNYQFMQYQLSSNDAPFWKGEPCLSTKRSNATAQIGPQDSWIAHLLKGTATKDDQRHKLWDEYVKPQLSRSGEIRIDHLTARESAVCAGRTVSDWSVFMIDGRSIFHILCGESWWFVVVAFQGAIIAIGGIANVMWYRRQWF